MLPERGLRAFRSARDWSEVTSESGIGALLKSGDDRPKVLAALAGLESPAARAKLVAAVCFLKPDLVKQILGNTSPHPP